MKLLFVDFNNVGHHLVYLNTLEQSIDCEKVYLGPDRVGVEFKQYNDFPHISDMNSYHVYKNAINRIRSVADEQGVDVIHILTGDVFYKYAGIGLGKLRRFKVIVTFHRVYTRFDFIMKARILFSKIHCGVVHSEYLKGILNSHRIMNVENVEYPIFPIDRVDPAKAKISLGLSTEKKTIVSLGGTRYEKGLDILLEALHSVTSEYELFIAGNADYFDEEYIIQHTKGYSSKVHLLLKYLTEEEYARVLSVADYVIIPYRKFFNGASGPLCDGVSLNKTIIGTDSGNIGYMIRKYKLGYIFEAENATSLGKVIEKALNEPFEITDDYYKYKEMLNLDYFVNKYRRIYQYR